MHAETVTLFDEARPHWTDSSRVRPLAASVWSPACTDSPSPVILLSHGTGGAVEDLSWLAESLTDAGFLVAGVDHHGNSYNDEYLPEGFAFTWERARDVSLLLNYLASGYDIDERRIGAAGFSIGGYTVAALLGARTNLVALKAVLNGVVPAPKLPEYPNMIEELHTRYTENQINVKVADGSRSVADERIQAGFVIAPAIGRLLVPGSLAAISVPFEIRWGEADDITPAEDNALVYLDSVPTANGRNIGAQVGHYDFLGDREDPYGARDTVCADAVEFFVSAFKE